ncbi:1266_t:CDS:2, partial [Racocetra fulgida]
MAIEYKNFIDSLSISIEAKTFFVRDLEENWISQEWILGFINGGRLSNHEDGTNVKPWTTNNFTEQMNKTIEEHYLGTQTVLTFIERIYGIKVVHSNLINNCVRRINQGKLKVLQNYVIEVLDNPNLFYV